MPLITPDLVLDSSRHSQLTLDVVLNSSLSLWTCFAFFPSRWVIFCVPSATRFFSWIPPVSRDVGLNSHHGIQAANFLFHALFPVAMKSVSNLKKNNLCIHESLNLHLCIHWRHKFKPYRASTSRVYLTSALSDVINSVWNNWCHEIRHLHSLTSRTSNLHSSVKETWSFSLTVATSPAVVNDTHGGKALAILMPYSFSFAIFLESFSLFRLFCLMHDNCDSLLALGLSPGVCWETGVYSWLTDCLWSCERSSSASNWLMSCGHRQVGSVWSTTSFKTGFTYLRSKTLWGFV